MGSVLAQCHMSAGGRGKGRHAGSPAASGSLTYAHTYTHAQPGAVSLFGPSFDYISLLINLVSALSPDPELIMINQNDSS